jgi:hypothetical protein
MDRIQAQRVIESLRIGIPPDGFVRHFTVGRKTEIDGLIQRLDGQAGGALLLKANYGSGKTHLLRFIREQALADNYAVSAVTLDAIRPFFNHILKYISERKEETFWKEISNNWKWDFSEKLDSRALFVALRSWATGKDEVMDIVEDWLYQPWNYKVQRKKLYIQLVDNLRRFFRDPRPEWKFYADEVFMFHTQGYSQSWAALRELDTLARASGLKGMIILFDEFEDVITNLHNVAHQEAAFWNLFHFYIGKQFPGKTFFAKRTMGF